VRRDARRWMTASVTSVVMLVACGGGGKSPASATPAQNIATTRFAPELAIDLRSFTKAVSGLYFIDVSRGPGVVATDGRKVIFRYAAFLPDGTLVDEERNAVEVELGPGMIRGLRDGINGMRAGGTRRLIVPPSLGYGRMQYKGVPPNSILVFEIQLLNVR
jgi:FKBP-type peptidyl-prolyl cis-trans isomerase